MKTALGIIAMMIIPPLLAFGIDPSGTVAMYLLPYVQLPALILFAVYLIMKQRHKKQAETSSSQPVRDEAPMPYQGEGKATPVFTAQVSAKPARASVQGASSPAPVKPTISRAPFRCAPPDENTLHNEFFHVMKESSNNQNEMTVEQVGIDLCTGIPWIWTRTAIVRGAFWLSDDETEKITFDLLNSYTGLGINENNWRDFVPQSKLEAAQQHDLKDRVKASPALCEYAGRIDVESYAVRTVRSYAEDIGWFRRSEDGYRAFYTNTKDKGSLSLSIFQLNEQMVDQFLKSCQHEESGRLWACDRLLSADEIGYFMRAYHEQQENDSDSWNDVFGGTSTETVTVRDGERTTEHGNTQFSSRMDKCIYELARLGVVRSETDSKQ